MPAKYELISGDLRRQIESGELRPGDQLPGEAALINRYRVSVPTIRQALAVLRTEGLIEARHGIGTFVRAPRLKVIRRNERHQTEKALVHAADEERRRNGSAETDTGHLTEEFSFSAEYRTGTASEAVAEIFGVSPDTEFLQRSYRSRFVDEDVPISIVTSYIKLDAVESNPALLDSSNEPWPGGTMHQLSTVGIEVDRVVEDITTRLPSPSETEALGLLPGTAVFIIRKTLIDINGRVVELSDVVLPGDRHRLIYTTQLERWT
ncbi:GntR family transcriptional regulator [Nocardia sp. NPDC051900]|uniref:GntR family transcriptional regulator n=1 Tax=Nocardia sp. NPDC051900 TaxID=3364326 RepID=UPI003789B355